MSVRRHTPASVTAPLSQQLRDREDEVETKHFVRSKSGVRLTEPGRTFLKEARSILAQSQRAVQPVTDLVH
jgi:DNA-binding transcriptional LysR family regulator